MNLKKIKNYTDKIKKEFHPKKIILFGSYSSKKADKESDVDLLVIMDTKLSDVQQAVEIRKKIQPDFPLDLIVRKPKEVKERIEKGDFFFKTILEEGKEL